jgi:hypothetical protein
MNPRFGLAIFGASLAATLAWSGSALAQDCNPPRILFVVDASNSMTAAIGDTTKWAAAQDAIHQVLVTYPEQAQYGLMTFPGPAGGCDIGEVLVDVGIGTEAQIEQTLSLLEIAPNAQTPAGQTLMAASQYPAITDPANFNYVIFVNDGWQYCSTGSGASCVNTGDCAFMSDPTCPTCLPAQPDGCYCVQDWPVLGATALYDAGVLSYVVGFGESVNFQALNRTANAGGTALPACDPNAQTASCYFQATHADELTAALAAIAQEVITDSCEGDCGISGTQTCTVAGWSDCVIDPIVDCTSSCGTSGTQECVDGAFTECSSEASCGAGGSGTGNTGAGATGAGTPTGGTGNVGNEGGAGNTGNVGNSGGHTGEAADPEEEGNCGCRAVGSPASGAAAGGWLLLAGLVGARRRRRS